MNTATPKKRIFLRLSTTTITNRKPQTNKHHDIKHRGPRASSSRLASALPAHRGARTDGCICRVLRFGGSDGIGPCMNGAWGIGNAGEEGTRHLSPEGAIQPNACRPPDCCVLLAPLGSEGLAKQSLHGGVFGLGQFLCAGTGTRSVPTCIFQELATQPPRFIAADMTTPLGN